jgi:hypothetical protein
MQREPSPAQRLPSLAQQRLGDFGFAPDKKGVKGVHVKLAAADKAKATRKARGTLGPKQRKKVKAPPPGT